MGSQLLFATCNNYPFYNTLQILWSQYIENFHDFISIVFPDTESCGIFFPVWQHGIYFKSELAQMVSNFCSFETLDIMS